MSSKLHQPKHIYLDDTVYFITASTYQKQHLLTQPSYKMYLYERIRVVMQDFGYEFYAWTILGNHYHTLFKSRIGKDLGTVIRNIHGNVSRYLNVLEDNEGRRVWQSYWDYCIRDKKDFYRHLNYIHHNCVKHGVSKKMEDYPFSSFHYWTGKKGLEWVYSCFREFPIIDFTIQHSDDF